MADSMGDPKAASNAGETLSDVPLVGRAGIIAIAAYLICVSLLLFYVLIKVLPRSAPSGTSMTVSRTGKSSGDGAVDRSQPSATASIPPVSTGNSGNASAAEPQQIHLFCGLWNPWLWNETRLLVIVILAGALGSLFHAIRSFYWYVGNRSLRWSWTASYVLLPLGGGILAMLFYFVVRGGFFSSQSTVGDTSPFAFAAFAALVGTFSSQAAEKLKQIASTVFAPAQEGKDHVGATAPPKIDSISPVSGPATGSTPITVTGTNFQDGAKISIGGLAASAVGVSTNAITATTPPHAIGKVDVEITNPDRQKATLLGGFTYL